MFYQQLWTLVASLSLSYTISLNLCYPDSGLNIVASVLCLPIPFSIFPKTGVHLHCWLFAYFNWLKYSSSVNSLWCVCSALNRTFLILGSQMLWTIKRGYNMTYSTDNITNSGLSIPNKVLWERVIYNEQIYGSKRLRLNTNAKNEFA